MTGTTVTLIRHGETEANREPMFQGHLNNPLSAEGVRQAGLLAERLANVGFDALYSSDLLRAVQTAAVLARPLGLEIRTSSQLREIDRGDWTGLPYKECEARNPDGWRESRVNPHFRCPNGESFVDLHVRTVREIGRIAALHPGMRIAIVTHGGPIRAFFRHAVGLPAQDMKPFEPANTSLSRFLLAGGQWELLLFNDHAHL